MPFGFNLGIQDALFGQIPNLTPAQRQKEQTRRNQALGSALSQFSAAFLQPSQTFVGAPSGIIQTPNLGSAFGQGLLGFQNSLQQSRQQQQRNQLIQSQLQSADLQRQRQQQQLQQAQQQQAAVAAQRQALLGAPVRTPGGIGADLAPQEQTAAQPGLVNQIAQPGTPLNSILRAQAVGPTPGATLGTAANVLTQQQAQRATLQNTLLRGNIQDKRDALNRASREDIAGLNRAARIEAARIRSEAPSKRIVNVVQRDPQGDDRVLATGRAESPEVRAALQKPNAFIGTPSRNVSVFGKTFEALSSAADEKARKRVQNKALDSVRVDAGVLMSFARAAKRANDAIDKGGDSVLSITGALARFGNSLESQAKALAKEFGLNTDVSSDRFTGRLSFLSQLSASRRAGLLNLAIVNARLSGQRGALSDGDVLRALDEIGARAGSKETAKAMLQTALVGALERVGDQVETRLDPDFLQRASNIRGPVLRKRVESIVGKDFLNRPIGEFGRSQIAPSGNIGSMSTQELENILTGP